MGIPFYMPQVACLIFCHGVPTFSHFPHYLDFKLLPCFACSMFSFGCFPGVWLLIADVSELSIGSIFFGSSMQCDRGWDVCGIYTWQVQAGRSRLPLKWKCIPITLIERGNSNLVNPGNHCYTIWGKKDEHRINRVNPPTQDIHTSPPPSLTYPPPTGYSPSYWSCDRPAWTCQV
jgi:hypothetical protein